MILLQDKPLIKFIVVYAIYFSLKHRESQSIKNYYAAFGCGLLYIICTIIRVHCTEVMVHF